MTLAVAIIAVSDLVMALVLVIVLVRISEVKETTNGMSKELQKVAHKLGFEEGKKAAEDEML